MPGPGIPAFGLLLLVPLVAWRLYSRFRRLVGRQRASRVRPWITLTLFPVIVALLAYAARHDGRALGLLAAALVAGAALGRYGLAKTQFEPTRQGLFYTPHAPLGFALVALFAGRIVYRLVELALLPPGSMPALGAAPSLLTLGIFGLLAGYYIAYAIGIVLWRRAVLRRVAGRRGEE
jgi:cytochrome b561